MLTEIENFYQTNENYYELLSKAEINKYLKYIDHLIPKSKGKILDYGCGTGQVVNYLNNLGYDGYGVDISPLAVNKSEITQKGKIFLIKSDNKTPFPDNYFDSVGCSDVLEHCMQPSKVLEEMIRVLKPEGKIVCACPNFLRIMGLTGAHHSHTKGVKMKLFNSLSIVRKLIYSILLPHKMSWDFIEPTIKPEFESDDDAICMVNPIDIDYILRKNDIEIIYRSGSLIYNSKFMNIMSELPLIRTIAGGCFITGKKS